VSGAILISDRVEERCGPRIGALAPQAPRVVLRAGQAAGDVGRR